LLRELQLPDSHFKFSRQSGSERNGTPPIGISAFASQNWVSSRYHHRARSYAALEKYDGKLPNWQLCTSTAICSRTNRQRARPQRSIQRNVLAASSLMTADTEVLYGLRDSLALSSLLFFLCRWRQQSVQAQIHGSRAVVVGPVIGQGDEGESSRSLAATKEFDRVSKFGIVHLA